MRNGSLTLREKRLILRMCDIAASQPTDDDGMGEGDYATWTPDDFGVIASIQEKLTEYPKSSRTTITFE